MDEREIRNKELSEEEESVSEEIPLLVPIPEKVRQDNLAQ